MVVSGAREHGLPVQHVAAREAVEAMCTKLLVNAVIEDYEIAIEG